MARWGRGAGASAGAGAGAGAGAANSIYEVFRACRLCGAGGGYKMPICGAPGDCELRDKIRDLTTIQVSQNDKMPPLICELCVDKVNDLFEFVEMCRQTNARTRERLGLPPQALPAGAMDAGDCILGVTEPVFVNEDSNDGEPLARQKNRLVLGQKGKRGSANLPPVKKRTSSPVPTTSSTRNSSRDSNLGLKELRVNMNGAARSARDEARVSRNKRREPTPPRKTRALSRDSHGRIKQEKDNKLSHSASRETRQKGILKTVKNEKNDDKSLLREKMRFGKRGTERDDSPVRSKKVKISAKPLPPPQRAEKRRAPTPPRAEPKRKPPPPPPPPAEVHKCKLCKAKFPRPPSLQAHMRGVHTPTFTQEKMACNPCGEWFSVAEDAQVHHRWHRTAPSPYVCRLCTAEFRQLNSYKQHFAANMCVPSTELPDVQCPECWQYFPGESLMKQHKCPGEDGRPGGKCAKCRRPYAKYKNLRKHEESCLKPGPRRKETWNVDEELLKQLLPMKVRVARCDPLLSDAGKHHDVSGVRFDYGLDKRHVYPYISSVRIKQEPYYYDGSNIKDEFLDEPLDYDDSSLQYESYSSSDEDENTVDASGNMVPNPFAKKKHSIEKLSIMSLKTIFSAKFLGPKTIQKKRKRRIMIKPESIKSERNDVFDSLFTNAVNKDADKNEKNNEPIEIDDRNVEKSKENDVSIAESETFNGDKPQEKLFDDDEHEHEHEVSLGVDNLIEGLGHDEHDEKVNNESEKQKAEKEGHKPNEEKEGQSTNKENATQKTNENSESLKTSDVIGGQKTDEENEDTKIQKTSEKVQSAKLGEDNKGKVTYEESMEVVNGEIILDAIENEEGKDRKDIAKEESSLDEDIKVASKKNLDLNSVNLGLDSQKLKPAEESNIDNEVEDHNKEYSKRSEDESPVIDVRIGYSMEAEEIIAKDIKEGQLNNESKNESDINICVNNMDKSNGETSVHEERLSDEIVAEEEKKTEGKDSKEEDSLKKDGKVDEADTMDDDALMAALDEQIGDDKKNREKVNSDIAESEMLSSSVDNSDGKQEISREIETNINLEGDSLQKLKSDNTKSDKSVDNDTECTEKTNEETNTEKKKVVLEDDKKSESPNQESVTKEEQNESTDTEGKISLDELLLASKKLLPESNDEKQKQSTDLDNISDEEFNFDA